MPDKDRKLLEDIRTHLEIPSDEQKALYLAAQNGISIITVQVFYDEKDWLGIHPLPDEIKWYAQKFDTSMYEGMEAVADYDWLHIKEDLLCDTPLEAVEEAITRYKEWANIARELQTEDKATCIIHS